MVATLTQVVAELRVEEIGSTERHLPFHDTTSRQTDKFHAPAEDKRIQFGPGIRGSSYRLGHVESIEDADRRVKVAPRRESVML